MRAFVVSGPGVSGVPDVDPPAAAPGEVVVDVERVGLCGTDAELFSGEMAYLHDGRARYPVRLGHEWCGTVAAVGEGVDASLLGRRVTGDTMLGCGGCRRCQGGRQHLCARRDELGIRGARPGALAEQLAVPARSLHELPDGLDATSGALVEPGGNALRAVRAAGLAPGDHTLVLGAGTIGLLAAMFARADGADVHLLDPAPDALDFARSLGFHHAWAARDGMAGEYAAVIDASNSATAPATAIELARPGGRVVYVGLATSASLVDSRALALGDITAVGVLSASPALAETVARYARADVDPRPLVAGVVGLDDVGAVLAGHRPPGAGPGPKIHVDPRRRDRTGGCRG